MLIALQSSSLYKRKYSSVQWCNYYISAGASILRVEGIATPEILGKESWGRWGREGRGRVVKYYYILSCTRYMFENGDFWREIE